MDLSCDVQKDVTWNGRAARSSNGFSCSGNDAGSGAGLSEPAGIVNEGQSSSSLVEPAGKLTEQPNVETTIGCRSPRSCSAAKAASQISELEITISN
jgi:hypothetical protein